MPEQAYNGMDYEPESWQKPKERRGSYYSVSSAAGRGQPKSQSMMSLQSSSSQKRDMRKDSMPANAGGRYITPNDVAAPFNVILKGEGVSSRRGSQVSMHSERSISMKW